MKTIIAICMLAITASILFTSCGGSYLSITKRHYNSGYYIVYNNGKPDVSSKSKDKAIKTKPDKPVNNPQVIEEKNTRSVYSDQNALASNNVRATSNEKLQDNAISQQGTLFTLNQDKIINNPVAQIKSFLTKTKSISDANHHHDRDGLSLFWVVILIILILWAIGLLAGEFGLGGLINVLLIIALVLLILWLLRIV